MAERLLATDAEEVFQPPGRRDAYPWDDWFDGSVWRLTHEEDFPAVKNIVHFQQKAYSRAKRRGLRVRTTRGLEGELFIQALPLETRERTRASKQDEAV